MSTYTSLLPPPVAAPIPGREADMVQNNAGGYTFSLSSRERLLRFLILGADGATYYATKAEHFKKAYTNTLRAIGEMGTEAVELIVNVSEGGRAPKQDAALFALALCAARGGETTRAAALAALPKVCRIPTHLFSFLTDYKALGGKTGGRALKRTLQRWYLDKAPDDLAYHLVKYRQRGGWTHRDVLRLCKPPGGSTPHGDLFAWATGKAVILDNRSHMRIIEAYESVKDENLLGEDVAEAITQHNLPREAVPDAHLKNAEVWRALLHAGGGSGMPMTALLRNLNRMTAAGVFTSSEDVAFVCARLTNESLLRSARVHPIALLAALRTYANGHGERGSLSWTPHPLIVEALEKAFLLSFGTVETSGKNFYVGLDVSGSMTMGEIAGVPGLSPRVASAALALLWAKTEPSCLVKGFTATGGGGYWNRGTALTDLTSDFKTGTLSSVQERVGSMDFGATEPALIIEDALKNRLPVDVFVVLTDNEVNSGEHPAKVLAQYRREVNPNAKLVVVGMTCTEFTLADPNDPFMLDVVGFDTATPAAVAEFAK